MTLHKCKCTSSIISARIPKYYDFYGNLLWISVDSAKKRSSRYKCRNSYCSYFTIGHSKNFLLKRADKYRLNISRINKRCSIFKVYRRPTYDLT